MKKIQELYAWTATQPNWVSALTHAGICAVWLTVGLGIALLSKLGDDSMALPVLVFFAGMCIGGYGLREIDDARKAVGSSEEGKKLGEGFEDFLGAVIATVLLGVLYAGLL